jgi:hypothetical protein
MAGRRALILALGRAESGRDAAGVKIVVVIEV